MSDFLFVVPSGSLSRSIIVWRIESILRRRRNCLPSFYTHTYIYPRAVPLFFFLIVWVRTRIMQCSHPLKAERKRFDNMKYSEAPFKSLELTYDYRIAFVKTTRKRKDERFISQRSIHCQNGLFFLKKKRVEIMTSYFQPNKQQHPLDSSCGDCGSEINQSKTTSKSS